MLSSAVLTMPCCAALQVGFMQTQVLNCLGCLWFDRTEVRSPERSPLEGGALATCVCPHFLPLRVTLLSAGP